MKSVVTYPPIGAIELCTRKNVFRTKFSVSAHRVRITTSPLLVKNLFPLSEERIEWIMAARREMQEKYVAQPLLPTTEISTCFFKIRFLADNRLMGKNRFACRKEDGVMNVYYAPDFDFTKQEMQDVLHRLLRQILRKEALLYLPVRLTEKAEQYGFVFDSVRINGATSRWGSCSATKRINLSFYLMLLPADLIDFVLVHELCHTEQMNHGEQFHRRMKTIFSDYDLLNCRLKKAAKDSLFLRI